MLMMVISVSHLQGKNESTYTMHKISYIDAVIPGRYTLSPPPTSVNGSSATGHCSNYASRACNDPASSVLFDEYIPTLTGLDGDTWASQLLTIQEPSVLILFDFTDTPNYTGVEAVEVVAFSCLEWGIAAREINLAVNPSNLHVVATNFISQDSSYRSCEHLVRYCIQGETTHRVLILRFNLISTNDWLHLAEVRFHTNSSACPHDTIITPPPPPTTTPPPATTSLPSLATTNTSNTSSQVPGPPQSTSVTTMQLDSTGANLILIAVSASVAFLLLLAVFMVAILIIRKCKHRKPYTNSLARDVELENHAAVSGDKPPLAGGGEAGASALHVQVYTEVNIVNHPTQTHQETDSGMDQLYDQVDIKSNIRRVSPSAVATENIVSQYSELQASDPVDQLYAQVDKKKGKKKKHGIDSPSSQATDMGPSEPVDQLYAQVDKKQKGKKKKKEPADSHSSETVPSQPPVMELYAQVDKKKKRKKKTEDYSEPSYSEPPAGLYDKKSAKQGSSATGDSQYVETGSPMDQLYAQVDMKKKGKKKAKEDKALTSSPETAVDQLYAQVDKKKQKSKEKEVRPEEPGAVYSVVNKPSPPQVPTKLQQLLEETG